MKKFFIWGSILMALGVMLGAFGAHSLEETLIANGRVDTFDTAVQYHFIHALALLIIGTISKFLEKDLNAVFYLMISGVTIFSGSLYILSITNITWLGAITPIGGVLFIISWIMLAISISKK